MVGLFSLGLFSWRRPNYHQREEGDLRQLTCGHKRIEYKTDRTINPLEGFEIHKPSSKDGGGGGGEGGGGVAA